MRLLFPAIPVHILNTQSDFLVSRPRIGWSALGLALLSIAGVGVSACSAENSHEEMFLEAASKKAGSEACNGVRREFSFEDGNATITVRRIDASTVVPSTGATAGGFVYCYPADIHYFQQRNRETDHRSDGLSATFASALVAIEENGEHAAPTSLQLFSGTDCRRDADSSVGALADPVRVGGRRTNIRAALACLYLSLPTDFQ